MGEFFEVITFPTAHNPAIIDFYHRVLVIHIKFIVSNLVDNGGKKPMLELLC